MWRINRGLGSGPHERTDDCTPQKNKTQEKKKKKLLWLRPKGGKVGGGLSKDVVGFPMQEVLQKVAQHLLDVWIGGEVALVLLLQLALPLISASAALGQTQSKVILYLQRPTLRSRNMECSCMSCSHSSSLSAICCR
jgi:hypothetical protein